MTYQWATATHRGRVRSNNQDCAHPEASGRAAGPVVVMVADGMGGHVAGEVAARLAVERAVATDGDVAERVAAGNRAILEEVSRNPDLAGMGTTLTLAELHPEGRARFAHVGDSRAYLWREGVLRQLTVDHTVVNEYLRAGKISEDEVPHHPQRSMLTRALGLTSRVEVDVFEEPLQPGDRLLLCSDGVNSMLSDDEIAQALSLPTAEEAAWELVERANRAGGHDNVTAVVVDVEP